MWFLSENHFLPGAQARMKAIPWGKVSLEPSLSGAVTHCKSVSLVCHSGNVHSRMASYNPFRKHRRLLLNKTPTCLLIIRGKWSSMIHSIPVSVSWVHTVAGYLGQHTPCGANLKDLLSRRENDNNQILTQINIALQTQMSAWMRVLCVMLEGTQQSLTVVGRMGAVKKGLQWTLPWEPHWRHTSREERESPALGPGDAPVTVVRLQKANSVRI